MMKTDTVLRQEGMRIFLDNLGLVEAERFVSLIIREPFDFAKWQQSLYNELTIEERCNKVSNFWNETHK